MTRYRKTFFAAIAAITTTIALAWDGVIEQAEATGLVTAWAGVLAVYWFPNDSPEGEPADPNISERGHSTIDTVLLGVIAFVAVIALLVGIPID